MFGRGLPRARADEQLHPSDCTRAGGETSDDSGQSPTLPSIVDAGAEPGGAAHRSRGQKDVLCAHRS